MRTILALMAWMLLVAPALASDVGVVVLHGKQGAPGDKVIAPLVKALTDAGIAIEVPEMCWSRGHIYDAAFPVCLGEVDRAVAALRGHGARRVVVAGMSLGGNSALAYGALHPDLAGVVAVAPAALPENMAADAGVRSSTVQARQMVAAGQGAARTNFADTNNGASITVTATPADFLSFVEIGGPADYALALPKLRVPVIWVAGDMDRSQYQSGQMFATLPANPLNRMVRVSSQHIGTPAAGAEAVLSWLKMLPEK